MAASDTLAPFYRSALAGAMQQALSLLDELERAGALTPDEMAIGEVVRQRFQGGAPVTGVSAASLAGDVTDCYHEYWRKVMLGELTADAGEAQLQRRLEQLLGPGSLDALTEALEGPLLAEGIRSLRGRTAPFYELMLWRREERKSHVIALPEGDMVVDVVYLHDFLELGWAAFATGDQRYTGGWAAADALYCVAHCYELDSEHFAVTYLAHEAQHFQDYARFPGLAQPELEYRAKLAELALARTTCHDLVRTFRAERDARRDVPHQHANARLIGDLAAVLGGADDGVEWAVVDVNAAAVELLRRDSEHLAQVRS